MPPTSSAGSVPSETGWIASFANSTTWVRSFQAIQLVPWLSKLNQRVTTPIKLGSARVADAPDVAAGISQFLAELLLALEEVLKLPPTGLLLRPEEYEKHRTFFDSHGITYTDKRILAFPEGTRVWPSPLIDLPSGGRFVAVGKEAADRKIVIRPDHSAPREEAGPGADDELK